MKNRTLMYSVASVTVLMVGTISVSAAPACQRLIRVYRERVVHHHVTQATAKRWAEWGKLHPNYRPKPKPALAPEETLQKIAIACEVPLTEQKFGGLLNPGEEIALLTPEEIPYSLATTPPEFTLVGTPLLPAPMVPLDDIPTPEPSTFILLGSALGLLALWKRSRLLRSISGATNLSAL